MQHKITSYLKFFPYTWIMRRYHSLSDFGKAYVWLTLFLVAIFCIFYSVQVKEALAMNPLSYECTRDNMMKHVCSDPYSSSFFWSLLDLGTYFWPLVIAWNAVGLIIFVRRMNL